MEFDQLGEDSTEKFEIAQEINLPFDLARQAQPEA